VAQGGAERHEEALLRSLSASSGVRSRSNTWPGRGSRPGVEVARQVFVQAVGADGASTSLATLMKEYWRSKLSSERCSSSVILSKLALRRSMVVVEQLLEVTSMRRDRYSSPRQDTVSRPPSSPKDSIATPRPSGSTRAETLRWAISGMSITAQARPWRGEQLLARFDHAVARGDREHRMLGAHGRVRVDRDVEHVDGGVVDVEVEHVLQAPAHRGLQFVGGTLGASTDRIWYSPATHADRCRCGARSDGLTLKA
jgi:hypothetical protein